MNKYVCFVSNKSNCLWIFQGVNLINRRVRVLGTLLDECLRYKKYVVMKLVMRLIDLIKQKSLNKNKNDYARSSFPAFI